MRFILAIFLVHLGFARTVEAQNLLATDLLTGDLYSVDCTSGELSLIRSQPWSIQIWSGLAADSTGRVILETYLLQQPGVSEIHEVNPATGQLTLLTTVLQDGINAIAFGPGDVLYAAIDLNYPTNPQDFRLFTIDLQLGTLQEIGPMGLDFIGTMDFDGSEMYAWSGFNGVSRVDLATGQTTDVNPNFLGNQGLSLSQCFSDNGALFTLNSELWIADSASGVQSYIGPVSTQVIFGGVEFIPGPEQVVSIWLSDQVGKPSFLECRGATPGAQVAVFYSHQPIGQTVIPNGFPCSGSTLDLNSAKLKLAGMITADAQGSFSLGPKVLPQQALYSLQLQALDLSSCTTSNPITVAF